MGKGPDLSAFPIPRKGGAKPIAMDEAAERAGVEEERGGEGEDAPHVPGPQVPPTPPTARRTAAVAEPRRSEAPRTARREEPLVSTSAPSGQTVATTVKLDENRYLRLADAGKPGPGRLKRRTIQEMVIEALDEWFERRGI
jgi:hypothetical protein